jgi:hypothetical protein
LNLINNKAFVPSKLGRLETKYLKSRTDREEKTGADKCDKINVSVEFSISVNINMSYITFRNSECWAVIPVTFL